MSEIRAWGPNWAPRGWALCQGQLLPIAQNQALFSLIGTLYGGDGRTTFGLPDLRGRVPMGSGRGPALANYNIGSKGGAERVTLTYAEMPVHNHGASLTNSSMTIPVHTTDGAEDEANPGAGILTNTGTDNYTSEAANGVYGNQPIPVSGNVAIGQSGGSQPHLNLQPFQVCNYIICLQGIFPSRS